jgi:parvulin-like peptidyl-prolyl isomerase
MKMTLKALALSMLFGTFAAAQTMATVNGTKIDSEEVKKVVMEGTQGAFPNLPKEKQDQLLSNIVEGMIMQELVYEDAKKRGLLKSDAFKQELAEMMKRIEKQLAARYWEEDIFKNVKVADADVKAHYEKNIKEYDVPETVHARHILLPGESEAKTIIDELKGLNGQELQQRFMDLAVKKSKGPSGPKGGDLGRFPRGQMVPEFDTAVFALGEGAITTEPVKTQFGYHVIYLEKKFAPKKYAFDEVKGFIEKQLKANQFKSELEKKGKTLQKNATITYGDGK